MSGINGNGNIGDDKSNNNNAVNNLVIGLNKSFQTLNIENVNNNSNGLSLSPHRNNNTTAALDPSIGAPQIATTASSTTSSFKMVVPNKSQRPRALSPLSKEKQRVSFSPLVVEINENNHVNNSNNNEQNDNIDTDNNNNSNNNNNNSIENNFNNNNNNNQLNSQNINIFINSLNHHVSSNDSKMTFNKLSGSSSEIFQFDEEYEEDMESKNLPVITEVEMADDDDDEQPPNYMSVEGGNRSRSNGIMQELKLGTSLPMEIPSKLAQSLQKNSVAMDFSYNDNEKKKYVTPRQSWVDTLNSKDEVSMSFAVPLSLSRKSNIVTNLNKDIALFQSNLIIHMNQ
ncbi:hypothetical protein PPL_03143 [Heterostelium album PN500]|uniref:Uncharacterized protein n=1 Tax=Heterostelium pallidum (strain ATCC 26659 / Pp 5 / PN500) TaxID=670386 RepID=D3B422_HETP5|nr:hypothetical protein PPL_03143 [Heterostelium album PN500]EFA84070.1 hypothetical protein PPL_03143 [Heterostelium album PN500]|eukprot:XP_020436187.1 hypothetical protein PPL_03143 [Heterostelium album PN500]